MDQCITFEEGWCQLKEGIDVATKILEGPHARRLTANEFMKYYGCAYMLCIQKPDCSEQLYQGYKKTLDDCTSLVVNYLMSKHNEELLHELVEMWSRYNLAAKILGDIFAYLGQYFLARRGLPSLYETAAHCFYSQVPLLASNITDALLFMIYKEREGGNVDVNLLTNVVNIICNTEMIQFTRCAVIDHTHAYYSRKASEFINDYSIPDYFEKVEECSMKESERLVRYLLLRKEEARETVVKIVWTPLMSFVGDYCRENNIDPHLLLQEHQSVNQVLLPQCGGLTLNDNNLC